MSRKKVSTTIYITPEQADRLKVLHERTKVPIAVYIREGIDLMLKHYEHVFPGQMSLESAPLATPPAATPSRREVAVSQAELPRANPPITPVTLRAGSEGGAARAAAASAAQEPPPAAASKPSRSSDGGA
jgi:predicted DNA-binding protein